MPQSSPDQLIDADGEPLWGQFSGSVARINGLDACYRTPMGALVPRWQRRFHYKQFQYFGIISDQLLLGCALADTAWMGLAFVYLFDCQQQQLHQWTWRTPLARRLHLSQSPTAGISRFDGRDISIQLGYETHADGLRKTLQIDSRALQVNATMREQAPFAPMSLCSRAGVNGWVYANKVAGLPVIGDARLGEQHWSLAAMDACGHHDFSAGFMRRETFWNWACLSGIQGDARIGLNLSCGVNETSFSENCIWLNDQLIAVSGVHFAYRRDDLLAPWQIRSSDGQVALQFTPQGNHRERLNVGLFASNFNQLFGRFHGTLTPTGGQPISISLNGFVEEQYAKW